MAKKEINFIGMSRQEAISLAEKKDMRWRIAKEDGRSNMLTQDMRSDRINFVIQADIVVDAKVY